jgi:hypothetical protein
VTWTDFWDLRNPDDLTHRTFTTVPAVTFGIPGVEYLVDVDYSETGTFMNLWSLTEPLSVTPGLTAVTVPVTEFTDPPQADQLGGGAPRIDVGGRRNRNAVYKDGSVWTAHSVGDATGEFARARYVRIDVNTAMALEDVAFGADGFWYYYPAVQPDGSGNLVMAFTRSGASEYASARYTGRRSSDPPGLMPSALFKAGEDNYVKTFGGFRNRWGDYSGIALDPVDDSKVWMFAEYAAQSAGPGRSDDRWGTWFGCTTFTPLTGAQILVDPPQINFGFVKFDSSSFPFPISITNQGSDTLTVTGISDPGGDFSLSTFTVLPVLGPFESFTFSVTFTPTTTDSSTGSIIITSNDPDNPTVDVSLSGQGFVFTAAERGVCFATTGKADGGRLITIDPVTGEGTLIGPTNLINGVPAVAINSSGEMFGTDHSDLYRIDAATGRAVFVASTGLSGLDALAFDGNDVLYGTDFSQPDFNLYTINTETGEATVVGPTGDFFTGLAFDPGDSTLWASTGGFTDDRDAIYTINKETGEATFVGKTGLGVFFGDATTDLHFDPAGNLYGSKGGGGQNNVLIRIDKETGAGTVVGPIGFRSVSGLAFHPEALEGRQVSANSIDFLTVIAGDSVTKTLTISNIGTEDLTVSGISIPDESFSVGIIPELPVVITPGNSEGIDVSFAPISSDTLNSTVTITSDDPDSPTLEVSLTGIGIMIAAAEPGVCYASTGRLVDNPGSLLTIDPVAGAGTIVGSTGLFRVPAIAINSKGEIFGTDGRRLYRISATTGLALLIAGMELSGVEALAFDASDVLYASAFERPDFNLYTVDIQTGQATAIGPAGDFFAGLAFDPTDGTLYGTTGGFSDDQDAIYIINKETGEATVVGKTGLGGIFGNATPDIHFDPAGNLFVSKGGGQTDNVLLTIDKSTGEGTVIGPIGFSAVSGLAYHPVPPQGRQISASSINFLQVIIGLSATKNVTVSNIGTEDLTVSDISLPTAPFEATGLPDLPAILPPSTSVSFGVTFTPTAPGGSVSKTFASSPTSLDTSTSTITLTSDDLDNPTLDLTLGAEGLENNPPEDFSLLSPANDSEIDTLNPELIWQQAVDFNPSDAVTYEILMSTQSGFSDTLISAQVADTTYTIPGGLEAARQYFWKVTAVDIPGARTESDTSFTFRSSDTATDVADQNQYPVPADFALHQNYPNPFNPETKIQFDLPKSARVKLTIFNLMGMEITTLLDEEQLSGSHSVVWDGRTDKGELASSGIYVYQLKAEQFIQNRKMIFLK